MRTLNMKTAHDWALPIWVIVTLVNFGVFALIALHLGGTAANGKISGGHFFLGSHSQYTEVSSHVFTYSKWHYYSVVVTFAVSFVATLFLQLRGRYRKRQDRDG